jgi:MFS family permease
MVHTRCQSAHSDMSNNYPLGTASLHDPRSTDVVEAASRILSRPYRAPSPSGSERTYIASREAQTPTRPPRSKLAIVPPNRRPRPTYYYVNESEVPDEWQRALKNSHITVWDGYALVRNNDTGEFRLVEKDRGIDDPSPISIDSVNGKGFNVAYHPASLTTSDGSPPSSSRSLPPLPQPEVRMSRIHEILFVINVCLAQLLTLAGLSQTIAPGFIIGTSLGADYAKLSLATASYGMALGTLILPAGRLGDMFGHKRIFMFGWLWFAVWSVFCGFSDYRGYTMLVGGRAMQGIGPALIVPNGIALIGRTFPMGLKRNFSISCFGGMGPIGMVTGSAFSSLCAQEGWWQWSFWALAITCALISMLSFFIIPADSTRRSAASTAPQPKWWVKFDLPGALTGVAGLVMINFAFNEAPIVGWSTSYIPFILVLGLICFGIFIYIELRIASYPLIPIKGLNRDAAFTLVIIACGWGR